jgi:AAA family ATP:ADP antiporter
LLSNALREKVDRTIERVFLLLGVLYPKSELDLVQASFKDAGPAQRANALEILDNVIDKSLKRLLLPLLDDTARAAKLRDTAELIRVPERASNAWLQALLSDENPWIAACAAYYAGQHRVLESTSWLPPLLGHHSPVVREAVLAALEQLVPGPELEKTLSPALKDEFEPVRKRAEVALHTLEKGGKSRTAKALA